MNEEFNLNGYDPNSLRNVDPEKQVRPEELTEPAYHAEPVPPVETSTEPQTFREQPVEAADFPEQPAQPEAPVEPETPSEPETPPEPSYNNYFYSSGPVQTARPAQNTNPQTGAQGYSAPNYGNSGYAAPNYNSANYGANGYGSYGNPGYRTPQYATPAAAQIPERETKKRGGWKRVAAAALACVILGGGAGMGGAWLMNKVQEEKNPVPSTNVQIASPRETKELNVISVDSGKLMTASQVYKANVNSTVGITTEITTTNFWGYQSTGAAAGSGFILTEDGYILTNEHVIEDANSITVAMYDGTTYPATLIGYDASNDIAVLKIDAKGLTPVTLGDSDSLEVGDEVVAIGNPLGELTFSLTKGNVSALNRAVTLSRNVTMNLIQTDTAINSGNSGGALFNMYGEVVGITNAKYSSSSFSSSASIDNIGFAIPINSVRNIVTSIIEKGYISTPYIGVTVGNVSEESQSYGMPQGAAIRSVEQGSPAEKAGLQSNDIVTAVNGEAITSYEGLGSAISKSQPEDKLELTVYRRGETLTITVTVGERTQSAIPQSDNSQDGYGGQSGDGFGGYSWGFPAEP